MANNIPENSIAIVGISGRVPGANNIDKLWKIIAEGKETISFFSNEDLRDQSITSNDINSKDYVKARGILDHVKEFDADFFRMSPSEAKNTDPQHRIFLECAYEALEDAGYNSENYDGAIGVYGGTNQSSYFLNNIFPNLSKDPSIYDFTTKIGNEKDYLTTRVSYKLNLTGPSLNIQTACSTSLVAICTACNHLLTHECDMALAGGVHINIPQISAYKHTKGSIFSKDGHCKPFCHDSDGTVPSNGAGVIILKRLEDAIKDQDHIYAAIRGYGINNDGSFKISYYSPSEQGQSDAISAAINMADIDPKTICYIEAHGTGTLLGDPIEIEALKKVYASSPHSCPIGSIKENIGHTFDASGVISLIKAILILREQKIPPSIHYKKPNPHINFDESPFYVNTKLSNMKKQKNPYRIGVSSFGIGGTNAHLILEEWKENREKFNSNKSYLLLLSAKTEFALNSMRKDFIKYLKTTKQSLSDIAYTLCVGRKRFKHKLIIQPDSIEDAIEKLSNPSSIENLEITEKFYISCFNDEKFYRTPLPTYPFEKREFWISPQKEQLKISTKKSDKSLIVKEEIRNLLKDSLGLDKINDEEDFFDLGGDSLLALEVIHKLSKKFNVDLNSQILLSYSTVTQLTKVITEKKLKREHIVKLKKGEDKKSVFFIHPIEGKLLCFNRLVKKLKIASSIYGIQAKDRNYKSFQELAQHYLELITSKQTNGPYFLLGASFGGIVAYEVARLLKSAGQNVSLLCMLDSANPHPHMSKFQTDEEILKYFLQQIGFNSDTTPSKESICNFLGLKSISKTEQKEIIDSIIKHLKLMSGYVPQPYRGEIVFVESTNQNCPSSSKSWNKLLSCPIELHQIQGEHLSMLKEENISTLVDVLGQHLN